MKATGITRQIDEVGRIVLPIELRRVLGIEKRDFVEIYTEGDAIILKKYQPSCIFCGSREGTTTFKGKILCKNCIDELAGERKNG